MVTEQEQELLNRELPKWPQMLVSGTPVTRAQAKEIIRRTDQFFSYPSGNNHEYVWKVAAMLGMPLEQKPTLINPAVKYPSLDWKRFHTWQKQWGYIETQYVVNEWISCAFIGGPHGWCHPDGTIGFVNNVGKYPSGEAIYEDWEQIAQVFPFLDLGITLWSGEEYTEDTFPIMSMRVHDRKVTVVDPREEDVHQGHPKPQQGGLYDRISPDLPEEERHRLASLSRFTSRSAEVGIPLDWIEDWAKGIIEVDATPIVDDPT